MNKDGDYHHRVYSFSRISKKPILPLDEPFELFSD